MTRCLRTITTLIAILLAAGAHATGIRQDSLTVSLVTAWPGPEVYELCGHEAIRVRGERIDSVWNYGLFDFAQPNFIYRFVKGETDYMCGGYPFSWFMPEYISAGRRVEEQDLNLTQDEARALLARLRERARPENCVYRYNYVKDNCATRIVDDIDRTAAHRVVYPDSVHYGTFRREMEAYHRDYPWYQFGIDLCLGSGIDYSLKGREEMFVPVEMHRKAAHAHFDDGRLLVSATRVLNEGRPDATQGATPPWASPPAVCWTWFAVAAAACLVQWMRKKTWRWLYTFWFGLTGLTGCLVAFLVFVSEHEATSPNILIVWLNPLQLVIAAGVWWRSWRPAVKVMAWGDLISVPVLLISWPLIAQRANAAFFPLMLATAAFALTYIIIPGKKCYRYSVTTQRNKRTGGAGARRSCRPGGGRTDSTRPAKARGGNRC